MSVLRILRIGELVEDILFSCQGDSLQRTTIEITEAGDVFTFVLPGEVSPLAQL